MASDESDGSDDSGRVPANDDHEASLSDTFNLGPGADEVPLAHPVEAIPRGAVIGPYVILGRIAAGGTGIVYAAFDPQRDRKIALKLLPIDDEEREEAIRRRVEVIARIKATSAVDHPCIIETYDVSAYSGGVAVAMEFIDGINLRQWMEARDDPFPWPEVLRVFREAGRGLAAAHSATVVHGDFKPDNVLMAKKGRICILDFGLATEIPQDEPELDLSELKDALPGILSTHEDSLPEMTELGPVMGTPAYMAPERHVGAAGDPRTDQFSFCVAFYEALYGERPFRGSRRTTLAEETIHNRVRDAPEGSEVPQWLREVLLRGLSPRRADRYPSMSALLNDLAHDPAGSRRRWLVGLGVVGGVVAVAAGMAYLLYFEDGRCDAEESELAGAWDPSTKGDLRAVIENSGRPHAHDTWRAVEARIDDWMTQWIGLRELACAATRIRRDASEELLTKRYACLDARLDEVAAFARVYGSAASAAMVDEAQEAVDAIAFPNDCISLETLETHALAPESLRLTVQELERLERDAWTALRAGNISLARSGADSVSERLVTSEFGPLRVDNTLLRGRIAWVEGDTVAAEALLHEAAARANAEGLQQPAAEAWLQLLEGAATDPKRVGETEVWARHAEHTIERLGNDRLRARLLYARGDIARARGGAGDALSLYHRGLQLLERGGDVSSIELAKALSRLGDLVADRGEHVSAGQYFERVVELRQQRFGAAHPALADALQSLGHSRLAQDPPRWEDAYGPLERAREIAVANGLPASRIAGLDVAMGKIELGRARAQTAADHFDRAIVALEGQPAAAAFLATALTGLGEAHLEQSRFDTARAALQEAIELRADDGTDPIGRGHTHEFLALALWEDDATQDQALTAAAAAIDAFISAGEAGATHRQRVRAWLDARQAEQRPAPQSTSPAAP